MKDQFYRGAKIAPKQQPEEMNYSEMVACFTHWMALHHPEVSTAVLVGLVQVAHRIALTLRQPPNTGDQRG